MAEVAILNIAAMRRFLIPYRTILKSEIPTPRPIPTIGPISGDISMAPMITAVEFTFNPTEAMIIAKMRVHRLDPRKLMPSVMESIISASVFLSLSRLK